MSFEFCNNTQRKIKSTILFLRVVCFLLWKLNSSKKHLTALGIFKFLDSFFEHLLLASLEKFHTCSRKLLLNFLYQ